MSLDTGTDFVGGERARASALNDRFDLIEAYFAGHTPGKLFIANGSGAIVGTVMSGDATMSGTGALTIGQGKVTSDKAALATASDSDVDVVLGTSYTTISTVTLAAGTWQLIASVFAKPDAGTTVTSRLLVAGVSGLYERSAILSAGDGYSSTYTIIAAPGSSASYAIQAKVGAGTGTGYGQISAMRGA